MFDVSDGVCTGLSVARRLFGIDMAGFLVFLGVPLLFSFVAMPGFCCFSCNAREIPVGGSDWIA